MEAVILAAGKSTRTRPLTSTRPKPLIPILNKPIIEYTLENLVGLVDRIFIVINYMHQQIVETVGRDYKGIPVYYVRQHEPKGSGHAIKLLKNRSVNHFLVLNGDDLYTKSDLENCLQHPYCILSSWVNNISPFGEIHLGSQSQVLKIKEKPPKKRKGLANTGAYVLSRAMNSGKNIFDLELKIGVRGEYELVDLINLIAQEYFVHCESATSWIPIGYPWDILIASAQLLKHQKTHRQDSEKGLVSIEGTLITGEKTIIKSSTIEGPVLIGKNCSVGPYAYIRGPVVIGDNCHIGHSTEIKNSVIFNDTKIPHFNYVGDSVIGSHVNLGAGTKIGNLRLDEQKIKIKINGQWIETNSNKIGAFIGDNVKTGCNVIINPGTLIPPNTWYVTTPSLILGQKD